MLEKGIMENSNSPFNAPVWVVPKKKDASGKQWLGEQGIVIDFRKRTKRIDGPRRLPFTKLGRDIATLRQRKILFGIRLVLRIPPDTNEPPK